MVNVSHGKHSALWISTDSIWLKMLWFLIWNLFYNFITLFLYSTKVQVKCWKRYSGVLAQIEEYEITLTVSELATTQLPVILGQKIELILELKGG